MMNRLCENVVFVDLFDLRVFDMLDPEFVRLKESRVQFNDRGKWKDSKEDVILFLEDVFQTDLVPLIGDGRNT